MSLLEASKRSIYANANANARIGAMGLECSRRAMLLSLQPNGPRVQRGLSEPLPSSAAGFRNSPYFALGHLLRDTEMLRPAEGTGSATTSGGGSLGRQQVTGHGHTEEGPGPAKSVPILGTLVLDGIVGKIISREHVAVLRTREQVDPPTSPFPATGLHPGSDMIARLANTRTHTAPMTGAGPHSRTHTHLHTRHIQRDTHTKSTRDRGLQQVRYSSASISVF